MSEPITVSLGKGRVSIEPFIQGENRGIVLKDTGIEHPVGELVPVKDQPHAPLPGEIYIRCDNRESALILMEQVARVVAGFSPPCSP